MWRPWGHQPQSSNPLGQGEELEGADNQKSGAQGRPVRESYVSGSQTTILQGPPYQRQHREDSNKEIKENQGDETHGKQPPQQWYFHNFNY